MTIQECLLWLLNTSVLLSRFIHRHIVTRTTKPWNFIFYFWKFEPWFFKSGVLKLEFIFSDDWFCFNNSGRCCLIMRFEPATNLLLVQEPSYIDSPSCECTLPNQLISLSFLVCLSFPSVSTKHFMYPMCYAKLCCCPYISSHHSFVLIMLLQLDH